MSKPSRKPSSKPAKKSAQKPTAKLARKSAGRPAERTASADAAPEAITEVFRFDPHYDKEPHFDAFHIPHAEWKDKKVLEVLHYIFETFDGSLAIGESCTVQHCGSCGIRMNGRSILACDVPAEAAMKLEPLHIKRVLKDLLIDQSFSKESENEKE